MFSNAKSITVNGISAKKITIGGKTLWEKQEQPTHTELPYVYSSGQFVDTGKIFSVNKHGFETSIYLVDNSKHSSSSAKLGIIGAVGGGVTKNFALALTRATQAVDIYCVGDEATKTADLQNRTLYAVKSDEAGFWVDGSLFEPRVASGGEAISNFFIGTTSISVTNGVYQLIYPVKIFDLVTKEIVGHYVPVKKEDGSLCIYDKLDNVYLENLGLGNFALEAPAPPASPYTEVEAISATGNAYISIPTIVSNESPSISIDMKLSDDLTRFYHGFSGSYVGEFMTNHASSYKFMMSIQEWQLESLANSDARQRQIVTLDFNYATTTSTLSSNLVEGSLVKTNVTTRLLPFNLFVADKYSYSGASDVYGLTAENNNGTQTWKTVVRNEDNAVGIYNEATDTFIGNTASVGSIFVVSEQSSQLMQLSIQPDGTPEQQQSQLLAMGAE